MYWPSPEESMSCSEEVVSPTRKSVEHSFIVLNELNNMDAEAADESVQLLDLSMEEQVCVSCGHNFCQPISMTSSRATASCDQRHRQVVCRHMEFPI